MMYAMELYHSCAAWWVGYALRVGIDREVAVDAQDRASAGARVVADAGRDLAQALAEDKDKVARGGEDVLLVFVLVRLEPVAVVVAVEFSQKADALLGESLKGG